MQSKRPPKDASGLAKYIVDVTTGEAEKIEPPRNQPHADYGKNVKIRPTARKHKPQSE